MVVLAAYTLTVVGAVRNMARLSASHLATSDEAQLPHSLPGHQSLMNYVWDLARLVGLIAVHSSTTGTEPSGPDMIG